MICLQSSATASRAPGVMGDLMPTAPTRPGRRQHPAVGGFVEPKFLDGIKQSRIERVGEDAG